jgi:hypothetical protein
MNKYKDYIARTQQDRIMLDILIALEEIQKTLKCVPKYNDEQIVTNTIIEQINEEVTSKRKRTKKSGGDK